MLVVLRDFLDFVITLKRSKGYTILAKTQFLVHYFFVDTLAKLRSDTEKKVTDEVISGLFERDRTTSIKSPKTIIVSTVIPETR